jgi:hypothetical protein
MVFLRRRRQNKQAEKLLLRKILDNQETIAAILAGRSADGPVPGALAAAARDGSRHVALDLGGETVLVGLSGPGDPRAWWSAIRSDAS